MAHFSIQQTFNQPEKNQRRTQKMNEVIYEKPKVAVVSAYAILLIVIIVAGAIHLLINCNAGISSKEYGMTTDQLRMEYYWVLLYIICGTLASLLVARHARIRPIGKILVGAMIMGLACFLAGEHLEASKKLAPIKREFSAAASHCHVVGRGVMDCGDEITRVLAKRDAALAKMGVVMLGEWMVTAPQLQTREIKVAAGYIPSPF